MVNYSQAHICQCLRRRATVKRNSVVTIAGNRRKPANGFLELGLCSGDVVAVCAFNSEWYLEWILAIAYIGGTVPPLNYRWDCSVRSSPSNYSWAPKGAVIICFTSGTTGRPKGVTISHSAVIVQSLAKIAMAGYGLLAYSSTVPHWWFVISHGQLMVGACHVLMPNFEAKSAIEAVEQHNVTSLISVPAIMADLVVKETISLVKRKTTRIPVITMVKQTWKGRDSVKKILNGSGGLSIEFIKEAICCFLRAKRLSAYWITETCSSIAFMTIYDPMLETTG